MKKNLGNIERIIRIILAVVFVVLYLTGAVTGTWGIILLVLAGVFLITSLIGFCPLYALFKFSTLKK